ncbi:MAG: DUF4255 domain-containing protein [Defluviitaleaceae bacterium]|nr:DUF4255 domain-containing protein [Defluviitaleaceae bacterium]
MADFSIISDTSTSMLKFLRENLCPEPLMSPESITLVSPQEKSGDFQLGMHLYDFKEVSEFRNTTPLTRDDNVRTRPPKILELNYMLFSNKQAQVAMGPEAEQRIFGRALQAIADAGTLNVTETNPYLTSEESEMNISTLNPSFEEKQRIWSALQCPYQIGIYFALSPVVLSSKVLTRVVRVRDVQFETKLNKE